MGFSVHFNAALEAMACGSNINWDNVIDQMIEEYGQLADMRTRDRARRFLADIHF
jgi:hypothetical protein